jgi:N-acetylglucosamine-6-phosphate deacetylase
MPNTSIKIITGATLVLPYGQLSEQTLMIEGHRIKGFLSGSPASLLLNQDDVEIIDGNGCFLTPGLIEQHFHGGFGCDFNTCSLTQVQHLLELLPRFGITGVLPTIMSAPITDMISAINTMEEAIHLRSPGKCKLLGIHLEGPFLTESYRGAHSAKHLVHQNAMDDIQILCSPNVKLVTLAPELDPDGELIRFLFERGIRVSAGHSGANLEEMNQAIEYGVRGITHLFNAMPGLHHRNPGILAKALTDDRLYTEVIADGVHVHPEVLKLAIKAKRPDALIAVSDCLALAGQPEGETFQFGGQTVTNRQGAAINHEGKLAGSTRFLNTAIQNLVQWQLVRFADAIQMATLNPAQYLGFGDRLGKIEAGYAADLVLWDKETLSVRGTLIEGQLVYWNAANGAMVTA